LGGASDIAETGELSSWWIKGILTPRFAPKSWRSTHFISNFLKISPSRYGMIKRYVDSLSKWVRNGVQHHNHASDVFDQLALFRQDMSELDEQLKAEMALNPPPPKVVDPAVKAKKVEDFASRFSQAESKTK
jgi:hypothetical protein